VNRGKGVPLSGRGNGMCVNQTEIGGKPLKVCGNRRGRGVPSGQAGENLKATMMVQGKKGLLDEKIRNERNNGSNPR